MSVRKKDTDRLPLVKTRFKTGKSDYLRQLYVASSRIANHTKGMK